MTIFVTKDYIILSATVVLTLDRIWDRSSKGLSAQMGRVDGRVDGHVDG